VLLLGATVFACQGESRASGGDVDAGHITPPRFVQSDPIVQRADSLVRVGRAWRGTALLAPQLVTPTGASPEARLVGARAAAGWEGWTEVERILRGAAWLDQQFAGEARELLARGALGRDVDALPDARLALAQATDDASRTARRVLVARAFDRAKMNDSAAAQYLAAAQRLPQVADWLRLRAAGVTADSAARTTLFARLTSAPAGARVTSTDAQARERSGDLIGAARQYHKAGAETSALRVEMLAAHDDVARSTLLHAVIAFLSGTPSTSDARQALDILDKLGTLDRTDELLAARAAATAGVAPRAIAGFARVEASSSLSAADRMTYAGALARGGRVPDAMRVYESITDSGTAPLAAYQRARLLAQSTDHQGALAALKTVADKYSTTRAAAAPALLLLADLQMDDGNTAAASQSLHTLVTRNPTASQVPLARFRAALIDWTATPAAAAPAFDSIVTLNASSDEAVAAKYWAARAYDRAGKSKEAAERWNAIMASAPLSYYAVLSAKRLHVNGWSAPAGPDTAAHIAAIDSTVRRIDLLQKLGMDVEARFETDALADRATHAGEAAAVTQALIAVGEPARALRVALAAIDRGDKTRSLYRATYPVVHEDALVEESRRNSLDPALVAGLIRQESNWNPHAVSVAGARGLMQLVPKVGAEIAANRHYPLWNPALLFDADVNLELGTAHLSSSLRRDTPAERALAAYNAGASRVTRWVQRPGTDDPELFTEWIPFTETRDYVRLVLRNAAVYRGVYGMQVRE
jgi:soluble lytic murein transglycosylase